MRNREDGKNSCSPSELCLWELGEHLKCCFRGLQVSEALIFVTISFPISWLFAIIAETRRVWFHFGAFICCGWRLRISVLFLLGASRVQERCFARLTESGVNIVFHSILVLFTWKEKPSVEPLNQYRLKGYLGGISIWRKIRIKKKKIFWSQL